MEKMVNFNQLIPFFKNKKVFVTGHTGFKGAWFIQILSLLQANVKGFALAPENINDLYNLIDGDSICSESIIHDIRDAEVLKKELLDFQPDYVFHLAAQPLVLYAYEHPLYTFEVNAQGTANLLDAIKFLNKKCVVVCITTDKVYENNDDNKAFKEEDKLGGYDPYSASKAAAEIIISSYRNSFFNDGKYHIHQKSISSVRAGNVIGGGDFAKDRIIPDIIHSLNHNIEIVLRNPHATRPWQHVIEPLSAYLLLASKMFEHPQKYNTSYNIGPQPSDVLSVEALTNIAIKTAQKGSVLIAENKDKPHEATTLMLDISKIKNDLNWQPVFNAKTAIDKTISWYFDPRKATEKCEDLIKEYFKI